MKSDSQSTYHLALDGNEANVANRVGSNVYAFELISEIAELVKYRKNIHITVLLSQPPISDLPRSRRNWRYKVVGPQKFWTQWGLPIHLFLHAHDYDVFFTPGHYAPRVSAVPYVSSVMDVAYLEYPEQFKQRDLMQLSNWTKYSVTNARKVIAISQHTKQDVIKWYGKQESDVVVAPPAVRPPAYTPKSSDGVKVCKKFAITDPYLVHVGTLQPRKNIERLITAFEQVCDRLADTKSKHPHRYQLVIVGKIGWLAEPILDRIKNSPYTSQIVMTNFVTTEEKLTLLKFAQASVNVGLYEGFGIPPLEAMHLGTIPVVSETTSLPEVVGKAGILVDPTDVEAIAQGLESALTMTAKERAKLRKAARDQLKKFTWRQSAEMVLNTLMDLAHDKR